MRALHLVRSLSSSSGAGVARQVSDLGTTLIGLGEEFHVLSAQATPAGALDGRLNGIVVHGPSQEYPFFAYNDTLQAVLTNLPMNQRLVELWESHGPFDVVVAHDWTVGMVAGTAQRLFGVPAMAWLHGTQVGRIGGRGSKEEIYVADMERWLCERADRVIVPSDFVRSEVEKQYAIPHERICVVRDGALAETFRADVDLLDFRAMFADPGEILIAFAGRLTPDKGPDILLEALADVLRTIPNVRLAMAGDGPMREGLLGRAQQLGLQDKVRFAGHLGPKVLGALYQAADLLVVPSRYEGGGAVVLEGLLHGLPVIATQVGGIPEIASVAKDGILRPAPAGDPQGLARAILDLLEGGLPKRPDPGPDPNRIPRPHSWEHIAQQASEAYGPLYPAGAA
jgi:glycogen(starch) synthase